MSVAVALANNTDVSDPPFKLQAPVVLDLPYPPSANKMWKHVGKRVVLTPAYSHWLHDAGWTAKAQRAGSVKGHYRLTMEVTRPSDHRKHDLDNLLKPVSDLLVSIGTITDDCLCEEITMRWVKPGDDVRVRVTIEPAEAP